MSLFLAISCLDIDEELESTIQSAGDVNIGIAFIGNYEFYESITAKYNVRSSFHSLDENWGVGKGRNHALNLYDGEDYVLQVDAHSLFHKGYEDYLVDKFKYAKEYVQNDKVVLSGYPSRYVYYGSVAYNQTNLNYPVFIDDLWPGGIPRWQDQYPSSIDKNLYDFIKNEGVAPLSKISAAFIFSDYNYVENPGVEKSSIFFEEELIQSMNLIKNNFTLVYPGLYSPFSHYYQDPHNSRGHRKSIFSLKENLPDLISSNYRGYVDANPDIYQLFSSYSLNSRYAAYFINSPQNSHIPL